jgi:Ca2+-binding RTX toxin-like protein
MRRLLVALVSTTALAGAFPASAAAGDVAVDIGTDSYSGPYAGVRYRADSGERNRLSIAFDGSTVRVTDAAGIRPGENCSATPGDSKRALCTLGDTNRGVSLRVELRDRSDRVAVRGRRRLDDQLGSTIRGGSGDDRIDVRAAGALPRSGHDGAYLYGNGGDDVLIGGPLRDFFDGGRRPNGSDTFIGGGSNDDWVTYRSRKGNVRADLRGDRDDGARGERDRIGRDIEQISGGNGNDRLVGNSRRNLIVGEGGRDTLIGRGGGDTLDSGDDIPDRGDRLFGGRGNDKLRGGDGPDVIDAGPGRDRVLAWKGRDRIDLRDRSADEVSCGPGVDLVRMDRLDVFDHLSQRDCERVRRERR